MSSDYAAGIRTGKLKLKGDKKSKKKNKKGHKRPRDDDGGGDEQVGGSLGADMMMEDARQHGDWFATERFEQITGPVCLEFSPYQYVRALDNGNLILGAPHTPGEGPDPEEIFIAIRVSASQIALKSGYNKYLAVDLRTRRVVGHSDAISTKEHFDPIFQDGRLALSSTANGCFLSVADESELPYLVAISHKVGPGEILKIRTNINPEMVRQEMLSKSVPEEEKGSLKECELNYVKKFQSFQDKKIRLNKGAVQNLKVAKHQGRLHEELLDRRSKMKSDKFCK